MKNKKTSKLCLKIAIEVLNLCHAIGRICNNIRVSANLTRIQHLHFGNHLIHACFIRLTSVFACYTTNHNFVLIRVFTALRNIGSIYIASSLTGKKFQRMRLFILSASHIGC